MLSHHHERVTAGTEADGKEIMTLLLPLLLMVATASASVTPMVATASASDAPCKGDPNHNVGDNWLCDDKCNTCTCLDDGSISATGLCCGDGCTAGPEQPEEPVFEATVVRVAFFFVCLVLLGCLVLCFFMCTRGGSKNASTLVREMEELED